MILEYSPTGINEGDDILPLPSLCSLNQNYPNPFNPSTTITYKLNKNVDIELNIYNMKGELVKTLVNENQNAGNYNIIWDGTNDNDDKVASGLYIYRIITSDYVESKKMLMLK